MPRRPTDHNILTGILRQFPAYIAGVAGQDKVGDMVASTFPFPYHMVIGQALQREGVRTVGTLTFL